jgi:hypothetical protein
MRDDPGHCVIEVRYSYEASTRFWLTVLGRRSEDRWWKVCTDCNQRSNFLSRQQIAVLSTQNGRRTKRTGHDMYDFVIGEAIAGSSMRRTTTTIRSGLSLCRRTG